MFVAKTYVQIQRKKCEKSVSDKKA